MCSPEELVVRDIDEAFVCDDAVGFLIVFGPVVLESNDDLFVNLLAVPAYLLKYLFFVAEGQPTHVSKTRWW